MVRETPLRTQCVDEKSLNEDPGEAFQAEGRNCQGKGHEVRTHAVGWRNQAGEGIEAREVTIGMTI